MKKIIATAESFGYGPIITCLYILNNLGNVDYIIDFYGSDISLEKAIESQLFHECIECNTYDFEELNKYMQDFIEADLILSIENPEGAKLGVKLNRPVFYIDNLFWLWNTIPNELKMVKKYFIVDTVNNKNLSILGSEINNKQVIGPLRDLEKSSNKKIANNAIINFGGGTSYLSNDSLVFDFYNEVIKAIRMELHKDIFIYVCGSKKLVENLAAKNHCSNIIFESYTHNKYIELLQTSKFLFLSPGLGNFLELLSTGQPVFFVPPINYSQFWQLEEYKKLNIGLFFLNWCDFPVNKEVKRIIDERIGVQQVLENIKCFKNEDNKILFSKSIKQYCKAVNMNWQKERDLLKKHYSTNGVEIVVKSIKNELKKESVNENED